MSEIAVGATFYTEFDVVYPNGPSTGQPVAPDSTPVVQLIMDGIVVASPPTITITVLTTGNYSVTFLIPSTFPLGANVVVFVNVLIASISYRRALGNFTVTPQSIGSLGDSPAVSAQAIYNIFGTLNVNKWADADNTGDSGIIASRIAWASNRAYLEVCGRLGKRYAMPFANIPPMVVEIICTMAGVILFRSPRGLVEGTPEGAQVKSIYDDAEEKLVAIISGRLVLIGATGVTEPTDVPQVVEDGRGRISPFFPFVQHEQDFYCPPESLWYQAGP